MKEVKQTITNPEIDTIITAEKEFVEYVKTYPERVDIHSAKENNHIDVINYLEGVINERS